MRMSTLKGKAFRVLVFAALVALTVSGLGVAGCSKPPSEKVNLTFFIFAGANQGVVAREVVEKYVKDHPNVTIDIVESSNALIYPQMVAHKKLLPNKPLINVGYFNSEKQASGVIDDMWLPLNPERIPNMKDLIPVARLADNLGVGARIAPVGLMYNSETCNPPPTSWTDLWNPIYKGRIVLWDYIPYQNLLTVAYAATGDYKNMDAAFQIWRESAAKMIHSLQTSNEGIKQALVTGGGWINPRSRNLEKAWEGDTPIRYAVPKEGQLVQPIYLTITKGSSPAQIAVAEELVNILLSPEMCTRDAELMFSLPVNSKSTIPESVKGDIAYTEDAQAKLWNVDWKWLAENVTELNARWDREVKALLK